MNRTLENKPRQLANIRAAVYGQPWAITEPWLNQICAIVENHVAGGKVDFKSQEDDEQGDAPEDLGFDLIDNVAIVNIEGPIFPRANLFTMLSRATSLEDTMKGIQNALSARPNALIANINSPGGSVEGLADFCDELYSITLGTMLPCVALINSLGASAAYMIACQFDQILATSGAEVGSIGVVGKYDDDSRAEKNDGIDPVVVRSHELKGIGNGAITPNQQDELERRVSGYFAKFQQAVSRTRPFVNLDKVSTGQVWMAQSANAEPSAQDLGLIDGISTLEKLINYYGDKT